MWEDNGWILVSVRRAIGYAAQWPQGYWRAHLRYLVRLRDDCNEGIEQHDVRDCREEEEDHHLKTIRVFVAVEVAEESEIDGDNETVRRM